MPLTREDFEPRMWSASFRHPESASGVRYVHISIWKNQAAPDSYTLLACGFDTGSRQDGRAEAHATSLKKAERLAEEIATRIFEKGFAENEEVHHAAHA